MGDFRRYPYSGHDNRGDRSRGYYGRRDQHAHNSRSGGHYSGSHIHDRGRRHENYGDRYSSSKQSHQRDYSSEMYKHEDWRSRRPDDEGPRRRLYPEEDYGRRSGVNMEALKYMERLRSSKPYLQKRKREILESTRRDRSREDELEDIDFCMDVISDTNADKNFGLPAIKTAYDKVLELVRNNPITSVPPVVEVDLDDDDDEISAPRSPSPEPASLRSDNDITVIPTERSQVKTDWNYRPDLNEYGNRPEASSLNRNSTNQAHSSTPASRFTQNHSAQRTDHHRDNNPTSQYNSNTGNNTIEVVDNGAEISTQHAIQHGDERTSRKDWEGNQGNYNYRPIPTGPNPWHQEGLPSHDQDMRLLENRASPTVVQDSSINAVPPMPGLAPNTTAFANNFNNGISPNAFVANIMNSTLMNQMMNGLQLTAQQQHMLAIHMVQNQAGLFSAASYPQIPNQQFASLPTMAQTNPPPVSATSNTANADAYSQIPRRPLLPTPRAEPSRNPFDLNAPTRYNRPMFRPRGPHVRPYRQNFVPNHPNMVRFQNANIEDRNRFGQPEANIVAGQALHNHMPSTSSSDMPQKQSEVKTKPSSNELSDPRLRARMERATSASKPADKVGSQEEGTENAKKEISVHTKATVLKLKAFSEIAASGPIKVGDKEAAKAEMLKQTLQVKKALAIKKSSDVSINEDYDAEQRKRERRRSDSESGKQSSSSTASGQDDSLKEKSESAARKEGDRPVGSVKGYRIPKIKKPEIPEPDIQKEIQESAPEDADQEHTHEIISSSPASPVDESTAAVVPVETEGPDTHSDTVSSTVSKHGLDADDLLKDYLMQSLPADKLSKINSDSMAKLLDSLKGELNAKLQQLSKEDEEEPSEVDASPPEVEEQVVSDMDDESVQSPKQSKQERKSRATSKKKPDEKRTRRSSLDKLHDALQSINFDAIMPLRPRRSTRGEPPSETLEEPHVRVTRKAKQKNTFIELGAEAVEAALKQVQIPLPMPDSTVEEAESKPVKGKRGRKRKIKRQVGRKPKVARISADDDDINKDDPDGTKDEKPKPRGRPKGSGKKRKGLLIKKGGRKKASAESRITRGRRKNSVSAEEEEEPFVPGSVRMETADEMLRFVSQTEEDPRDYNEDEDEHQDKCEDEGPCEMDEAIYDVDMSYLDDDISSTYNSEMARTEGLLPGPALSDSVKRFCDLVLNPRAEYTVDDSEVPAFAWKPYEPTFTLEDLETPFVEDNCTDMSKTEVKDSEKLGLELPPKEPNQDKDVEVITLDDRNSSGADTLRVHNASNCKELPPSQIPSEVNQLVNENAGINTDTCQDVKADSEGDDDVTVLVNEIVELSTEACQDAEVENEGDANCKVSEDTESGKSDDLDVKPGPENLGAVKKNKDMLKEFNISMPEQRIQDLEGHSLYKCANEGCRFTAPDSITFRDHTSNCGAVGENKQLTCFHCDKKLKTISTLLEHLKTHGRQRQICTLCSFRCWLNIELAKHMKLTHKVTNYKIVKQTENGEAEYLMYPKDVWTKLAKPFTLQDNSVIYCPRVEFAPGQASSIPLSAIFPSFVYCAMCPYSTKVRSNIIRHLRLHEQSKVDGGITQVPTEAPVNPVPHLERNELMFDKMTNWAGSTHANKEKSGVASQDALKVPQFVLEQFRYVCSVPNCKQLTGDEGLLRSHMKALHSEVDTYVCPHCQSSEHTKHDSRNSVSIDKIGTHLKLHGSRLLKCGHCDYIHIQTRIMERHVTEKHPEKKRIHFMIRNLDGEGNNSNRRLSVEEL